MPGGKEHLIPDKKEDVGKGQRSLRVSSHDHGKIVFGERSCLEISKGVLKCALWPLRKWKKPHFQIQSADLVSYTSTKLSCGFYFYLVWLKVIFTCETTGRTSFCPQPMNINIWGISALVSCGCEVLLSSERNKKRNESGLLYFILHVWFTFKAQSWSGNDDRSVSFGLLSWRCSVPQTRLLVLSYQGSQLKVCLQCKL